MSFNPKGKAVIKSIELTQGTSDDANTCAHIHLAMSDQPSSVVRAALGVDEVSVVENAFFRPVSQDADRNPNFLGLKSMKSNAKWEARHAVKFKGLRQIRIARLGGILLLPRGKGTWDLAFDIVIEQPPEGFTDALGRNMHTPLDCEFEHDAELALGVPEGGQAGMPPPPKKANQIRSGKRVAKKSAAPGRSIGNKPARKKVPRKTASGSSVN